MSDTPTTEQSVAKHLTDAALADRLDRIAHDVRYFDPATRRTFLQEAADRLRGAS